MALDREVDQRSVAEASSDIYQSHRIIAAPTTCTIKSKMGKQNAHLPMNRRRRRDRDRRRRSLFTLPACDDGELYDAFLVSFDHQWHCKCSLYGLESCSK